MNNQINKPSFEGTMNRIQKSLDIDISVTIKKIVSLSEEELKPFIENFQECEPLFWEAENFSEKERELSKLYNFNLEDCVKEDDFVMFNFPRSEGHILVDYINKQLNIYSVGSVVFCDTFFAHVHDDTEAVDDTGQLMVVIENKENHILYSSDFEGNDFTIVPKAGDIIFLNIWAPHAVLPNQSNGIDAMRQNSMKLVCFN